MVAVARIIAVVGLQGTGTVRASGRRISRRRCSDRSSRLAAARIAEATRPARSSRPDDNRRLEAAAATCPRSWPAAARPRSVVRYSRFLSTTGAEVCAVSRAGRGLRARGCSQAGSSLTGCDRLPLLKRNGRIAPISSPAPTPKTQFHRQGLADDPPVPAALSFNRTPPSGPRSGTWASIWPASCEIPAVPCVYPRRCGGAGADPSRNAGRGLE